jgi:F420H(2)-dependent quinone reductase
MRPMNLVPTAILRGPAHRLMSRSTLLLTFHGRKTARAYTVPIVYYQDGNRLLATTDSRWWHNLTDGADVIMRLRGRDQIGHATADPDPSHVAPVLAEMVHRYPRRYRRLATQHAQPGMPARVLIEITLTDADRTGRVDS